MTQDEAFKKFTDEALIGKAHQMRVTRMAFNAGVAFSENRTLQARFGVVAPLQNLANNFAMLCKILPEEFMWGDKLYADTLLEILMSYEMLKFSSAKSPA